MKYTCEVVGCSQKRLARRMCSSHYHRVMNHGSTEPLFVRQLHGDTGTPLYRVWTGIRRRTTGPHPDYGGRGIAICSEWLDDFLCFKTWALSNGWVKGLHVNRIDNDGPYSPANCNIITAAQNSLNKRTTVLISAFGETKALSEWATDVRCVVTAPTVRRRIDLLGWGTHEALTTPSLRKRV